MFELRHPEYRTTVMFDESEVRRILTDDGLFVGTALGLIARCVDGEPINYHGGTLRYVATAEAA
jgi:hypothetical protein